MAFQTKILFVTVVLCLELHIRKCYGKIENNFITGKLPRHNQLTDVNKQLLNKEHSFGEDPRKLESLFVDLNADNEKEPSTRIKRADGDGGDDKSSDYRDYSDSDNDKKTNHKHEHKDRHESESDYSSSSNVEASVYSSAEPLSVDSSTQRRDY